jgi:hypothetical protein
MQAIDDGKRSLLRRHRSSRATRGSAHNHEHKCVPGMSSCSLHLAGTAALAGRLIEGREVKKENH